jgi:GR25 family glycosyltransferase involved in LPS biosynthesis
MDDMKLREVDNAREFSFDSADESDSASGGADQQSTPFRLTCNTLSRIAIAVLLVLVAYSVLWGFSHYERNKITFGMFDLGRTFTAQDCLFGLFGLPFCFAPIGSQQCEPATSQVAALRNQSWPSLSKSAAPVISEVIYMNLDSDPLRREYMEQQFDAFRNRGIDIKLTRFSAVAKSAIANSLEWQPWRLKGWANTSVPNISGNLGVAGCAASHYKILLELLPMEMQLVEKGEVVLISEDDAQFSNDFVDVWKMLWQYLPDDWDLVRVGWYGDNDKCSNRVNPHVDRAGWSQRCADCPCHYCGTQAQIPRPGHFRKLLQRFELSKITHADILYSAPRPPLEDPSKVPELNIYATMPLLAMTARNAFSGEIFNSDRDNNLSHTNKDWWWKIL